MPEPTKKDMAAARVICACRGACSDLVQPCDRRARIARALSAAREEGRAEEREAWEESHGYYLCVSKKQAQADINESHGEVLAWQAKARAAQDFAQKMQHERDFALGVEAPAEFERGREEGLRAGLEAAAMVANEHAETCYSDLCCRAEAKPVESHANVIARAIRSLIGGGP